MVNFIDATIEGIAIHKVGNKLRDEGVSMSDNLLTIEPEDRIHLMDFFCRPFPKSDQVFNLYHANDLSFNIVNSVAFDCFSGNSTLLASSQILARHLYDVSQHLKIRGGEFYVVRFKDVVFEGEYCRAIGLYKSDNREMYAKVSIGGDVVMEFTQAINTHHLDQAALIIESVKDQGYEVVFSEIHNRFNLQIWKDEFIQVKIRNDAYQQTSNLIKITKQFIVDKMDDMFELEKVDKIDMLNKTGQYFKEHETYDQEEFMDVVFGSNEKVVALFTDYKHAFTEEFEIPIKSSFDISDKAVKKVQTSLKSVIKLDKNAHIYLHGKRDIIEKGFDEQKGMNFYKVYFENEG